MADKKISDFTEATSVDPNDYLEIENTGGNSRKVKASKLGSLVLLDSFTFTGSESTVTFSSIPGTFKDLILVFHGRSDRAGQALSAFGIRFNGDTTAANYYSYFINAANTTVNASAAAASVGYALASDIPAATAPSGYSAMFEMRLVRYAGTTFQKSAISDLNFPQAATAAGHTQKRGAAHWLSTSAVTSVTLFDINSANFTAGSTVEIYGRGF